MPSDDLPGLEPDPTPEPPHGIPEVQPIEPATYDGLTDAQLDAWFEEYGGQAQFDKDHRRILSDMRDEGGWKEDLAPNIDPDLRAVLMTILEHENPWSALGGGSPDQPPPTLEQQKLSMIVLGDGWLTEHWSSLSGEIKARFRRYVDSKVETTTPPGKELVIVGTTIATVVLASLLYFGTAEDTADTGAAGATPPGVEQEEPSGDSEIPTDADAETPLPDGADAEGDMFGSSSAGDADSPEAAASDITASAYFLNEGVHVFQMKVRGDGEALAASDVRWYNPRFIIQTPQGEFAIDVRGKDGTATVIDSGPFSDPQQIVVDVDWIEPGCLQVAATIIGLTDEATSFRTELTVRLADGTTFEDDASFGGG